MGYATPAPSDFKAQFQRDFTYAVPGFGGAVHATLVGPAPAGIAAIVLDQGGARYALPPTFTITDLGTPPGAGATLGAATVSKGAITAAPPVTAPGAGYIQPVVAISGGGGDNTDLEKVTDSDLQSAIADAANFDINQGFFAQQADFSRAFLFLAAHYLVGNIQASMEGLSSKYDWLTTSKSVGDVSESYQIPEWMARDPMLADFSKTRYGAKFLTIISPFLVGHTMALCRVSNPV